MITSIFQRQYPNLVDSSSHGLLVTSYIPAAGPTHTSTSCVPAAHPAHRPLIASLRCGPYPREICRVSYGVRVQHRQCPRKEQDLKRAGP